MTDKPENPPAYPFVLPTKYRIAEAGMTLRDWFAGQAVAAAQTKVAAASWSPDAAAMIAEWSYRLADAMLAERSKP